MKWVKLVSHTNEQNVLDSVVSLPVALERVDTDLAVARYVRVEDARQEEAFGRLTRKTLAQH